MRLNGRITIYGEYLMHQDELGLIESSRLYLTNETDNDDEVHFSYNPEFDKTLAFLNELKIQITNAIKGNLPLGYGFSSSTILSFLHLGDTDNIEFVNNIDHKIHGFKPSGLDATYCFRNKGGLYGMGKWLDCKYPEQNWDCILLPKEKNMNLADVQKGIQKRKNNFLKLITQMNKSINRNEFPLNSLFDYSVELQSSNVYSENASRVIDYILNKGIVAKCIGGLYDKAIILNVNNASFEVVELIKKEVNKIKSSQYLEKIQHTI